MGPLTALVLAVVDSLTGVFKTMCFQILDLYFFLYNN